MASIKTTTTDFASVTMGQIPVGSYLLGFDITNGKLSKMDSDLVLTVVEGGSTIPTVPHWIKITKTHADFATASTTNDIEIYSLPAYGIISDAYVKNSIAFNGGSLSSYKINIATNVFNSSICNDLNVFNSTSPLNFMAMASAAQFDYPGILAGAGGSLDSTSIRAYVTSIGDNIDQATQGSVDIWLLVSVLQS